jgi:hypothetical protein
MNYGALLNLFLGIGASLIPLYRHLSFGDVDRTSKEIAFVMMALFSVACLMPFKRRSAPLVLKLFPMLALFAFLFNQYFPMSMALIHQALMTGAGLMFLVCLYESIDVERIDYFYNALSIGVILQALIGILEYFKIYIYRDVLEWLNRPESRQWMIEWAKIHKPEWTAQKISELKIFYDPYNPKTNGVIGTLKDQNTFGAYLSICSVVLLRPYWSAALPIVAVAVILCKSLTPVVTLLTVICMWAWVIMGLPQKSAYGAILAAIICGIGGLAYLGGGHDSLRFAMWRDIISMIDLSSLKGWKDFIFGHGFGWYAEQFLVYGGAKARQEHNNYLTILNTFGLSGVILFFMVIAKGIGRHSSPIIPASMAAILVNGVANFSLYQAVLIIPMAVMLCTAIITNEKNDGINLER